MFSAYAVVYLLGRRRGVEVSGVRRANKVNQRRARLVLGRMTVFGWVTSNQPTRSTQPRIPPGSLDRVLASVGVSTGMASLPGGR